MRMLPSKHGRCDQGVYVVMKSCSIHKAVFAMLYYMKIATLALPPFASPTFWTNSRRAAKKLLRDVKILLEKLIFR